MTIELTNLLARALSLRELKKMDLDAEVRGGPGDQQVVITSPSTGETMGGPVQPLIEAVLEGGVEVTPGEAAAIATNENIAKILVVK